MSFHLDYIFTSDTDFASITTIKAEIVDMAQNIDKDAETIKQRNGITLSSTLKAKK